MITKKRYLIIIPLVIITSFVLFFVMRSGISYPEELSLSTSFCSYSPEGMLYMKSGEGTQPYAFCDFKSSQDVIFCSKPNCLHNGSDCFAFVMRRDYTHPTLYGGKLYYIKTSYGEDQKAVVTVYKSNPDGSRVRTVLVLDDEWPEKTYVNLVAAYFFGGNAVMHFDLQSMDQWVSTKKTNCFVGLDIKNGETWSAAQLEDYNGNPNFLGVKDDCLYFSYHYFDDTTPNIESPDFYEHLSEYMAYYRQTLYVINLKDKTFQPFNENFADEPIYSEDSAVTYTFSDQTLYRIILSGPQYEKHSATAYNLPGGEVMDVKTYHIDNGYNYSCALSEDYLILSKDNAENWDYYLFNTSSQSVSSMEMFMAQGLYGYSSPFIRCGGNWIISKFITSDTCLYYWISHDDLVNNRSEGLYNFQRIYS